MPISFCYSNKDEGTCTSSFQKVKTVQDCFWVPEWDRKHYNTVTISEIKNDAASGVCLTKQDVSKFNDQDKFTNVFVKCKDRVCKSSTI